MDSGQFPQWDEKQYGELTGQPHPDIMRYIETRHLPAPKSSAPQTPAPSQKPALDATTALIVRIAPPVIALTALGSIVCVIGAVTAAVIGAGFAFITANVMYIGGGVVVVVGVALAFVGRGAVAASGSGKGDTPPPPNDGGKYEWYQKQEQGWRKM